MEEKPIINRKMAITILYTMAERLAKRYDLTIISHKDSTNGLWESKEFTGWVFTMSEFLADKYGKLEETHFTKVPYEEYDLRKDFKVSFEYRFSNPQICIGTQWGEDGFAELELREDDGNYSIGELRCFRESGIKYMNILKREWKDTVKEFMGGTNERM